MELKDQLVKELKSYADKDRAKSAAGFFKTGKGEYGEGDVFIGVRSPDLRLIAKKYFKEIAVEAIFEILRSPIHEQRLLALFLLNYKFTKVGDAERKQIVDLYLKNLKWVNNWDLVDSSAHYILGEYMIDHPEQRKMLYRLLKSKSLWERRIAILTTFAFIRVGDYADFLKIAEILLDDERDLIHKAVGWMLREIGKRDLAVEEEFLDKFSGRMPRTMLRYAIEKFSEEKRKFYME